MAGVGGVGGSGGNDDLIREMMKEQESSESKQAQGAAENDPGVDDKKAAEEAAAAAAAQQAATTQAINTDTVVTGTQDASKTMGIEGGPQKSSAPGDTKEPFLDDSNSDLSPKDAANVAGNIMNETAAAFDNMSKAIDMEYAKLIRECKNNIEELEQKIKEFTQKIKELKDQADKIMKIADKMEKLLPEIMAYVGTDRATLCNNAQEHNDSNRTLATLITQKCSDATGGEVMIDPEMAMNFAECIQRGGPGATALAMTICMQICELSADREINANRGAKLNGEANAEDAGADATDPTDQANVVHDETLKTGETDPTTTTPTDPAAEGTPLAASAEDPATATIDASGQPVAKADGTTTGTVDPLDPTSEVVDQKPISDAEAFLARLENLSKFAANYANADPYGMMWFFGGTTKEFDEANAALINAIFPGMGTGPNNYKIGSDFKGPGADGKGGVAVEGFAISGSELALASMLPGKMAGEYLGAIIKNQAKEKLAEIDKQIAQLQKAIQAAKNEIKDLQKEIGELEKKRDKEKDVIAKEKQKALEQCQKIVDQMKNSTVGNEKKVLETLNDAISEIFNQTIAEVMAVATGKDDLTANNTGVIR